jgi:hypothetical protein
MGNALDRGNMNTVKETTLETFRELSSRIRLAKDSMKLDIMGDRITRHYNNGTITASQLSRLDGMIQKRLAEL